VPVAGRLASTLTYAELDQQSDALAAGMIEMGLKKGDRVAIIMPNIAAFAISFYAILKAGGVVAATNPTYPPDKLQYQINDCDAEIVLTMSLYYKMFKGVQSKTKVKTVIVANVKEYLPGVAKFLFTLAKEKKDGHRVEALATGDYWKHWLPGITGSRMSWRSMQARNPMSRSPERTKPCSSTQVVRPASPKPPCLRTAPWSPISFRFVHFWSAVIHHPNQTKRSSAQSLCSMSLAW